MRRAKSDGIDAELLFAWLLRRAPNILLIPGTSSIARLQENLAAAEVYLPKDILNDLDGSQRSATRISAPDTLASDSI
jgi:pyridoxine 4-dehydrogenase